VKTKHHVQSKICTENTEKLKRGKMSIQKNQQKKYVFISAGEREKKQTIQITWLTDISRLQFSLFS
jgi:hypothetical protein